MNFRERRWIRRDRAQQRAMRRWYRQMGKRRGALVLLPFGPMQGVRDELKARLVLEPRIMRMTNLPLALRVQFEGLSR